MRYIQMIKRCKIPLKKATSDMEAHGEEQAKRCGVPTADLRVPCWEDRLGHLRHSAVARLLIEGTLPVDNGTSGPLGDGGSVMDLSKSSVLDKARNFHRDEYRMKSESMNLLDATADRVRHQMGVEMEALKTRSSTNEVRFGGWKCRYCPYNTNTSKKLYSHYQFHQQLLTSQSSKPHMEWLTAYRQAKEFSEANSSPIMTPLNVPSSTTSTSPPGGDCYTSHNGARSDSPVPMFSSNAFPSSLDDPVRLQALRANGLSLRYLLGGKGHLGKQTTEEHNSASGCLRSIVQAVMNQGTRTSQTSVTTTSVYASLVNSSSGLSPKVTQRQSPCIVSGPVTSLQHLPGNQTIVPVVANVNAVSSNDQGTVMHMENTRIVRPQPRRAEVLGLQTHNHLGVSNGHVDNSTKPGQGEHTTYKHANSDCPPVEVSGHDSPPRRIVTVERQVSLQVPERPASRESTSSFTSSASSEINVDDSPMPFNTRRIDSLTNESSHSDLGIAHALSRKRSHSTESNPSCRSKQRQHHSTGMTDIQDLSCRTEELEMNPTAKMIRLDYAYKSLIKEERATTPEIVKFGNASPTAVISSTGTPPPTTNSDFQDDLDSPQEAISNIWKPTPVTKQDSGIQCELLVPPSGEVWANPQMLGPEAFTNLPDQSTNQDGGYFQRSIGTPIVVGSVKCPHCGIMFDDSVLHSIHMGCHSHSDPFICNVCGEQCSNKYGFYTHIMRGHHKH